MGVLSILTEEFLESLPDDDPAKSFTMIVRRCEEYLADRYDEAEQGGDSGDWQGYQTEQYTVMRTLISAAQRLEITPFSEMDVPVRRDFRSDDFNDFKHDVDHYLAQFVLDRAFREKRESVAVPPPVKDRLRSHIHAMRTHIDNAAISDSKRAKLHAKLAEFEASLEKDRIPIFKMARVLIEILSISANVIGVAESRTMAKLTGNIMEVFAEAKAADDESRRPAPIDHKQWIALPPNRKQNIGPREAFVDDSDDNIPF